MPSIEEQKKQRVLKIATIITCSMMISVMIAVIKRKYVATLDHPDSLLIAVIDILAFVLILFCGYAAGRGCAEIKNRPYEK